MVNLYKLRIAKFWIFSVLLRTLLTISWMNLSLPTGSIQNTPKTRVCPGRSAENIAAVSESVQEDPKLSFLRRTVGQKRCLLTNQFLAYNFYPIHNLLFKWETIKLCIVSRPALSEKFLEQFFM